MAYRYDGPRAADKSAAVDGYIAQMERINPTSESALADFERLVERARRAATGNNSRKARLERAIDAQRARLTEASRMADHGTLCEYGTAAEIRPATAAELHASAEAARRDGGRGVISIDGRAVYVIGDCMCHACLTAISEEVR